MLTEYVIVYVTYYISKKDSIVLKLLVFLQHLQVLHALKRFMNIIYLSN